MNEGTPNPKAAREWPVLLVLVGIQFGHILDFDMLLPLGPRYQSELDLSPAQFGLVVAAYALAACVSGLLAATCIDRFDRKRVLLILKAGFILATLLCGMASSYEVLLLGRCLAGALGGVLGPVVFAMLGDLIPERRRAWATGVVLSAFAVATIAGVPLALTLAQAFGTGSPFIVLAGFSTAVLLLAACVLPALPSDRRACRLISPWQVLVQPTFLRAHVLMAAVILGTFILIPYLPAFLLANVGWQESDLRWLYLCGGLATLVANPLAGRLADGYGKVLVFRGLVLVTMLPIVLVMTAGPGLLGVTLAATTMLVVCSSAQTVPALALITSCAPPASRGSFLSVNAAVQQLAMGLAALLAGSLVCQAGPGQPLEGYPLVGLLACAVALLSFGLAGAVSPADASGVVTETSKRRRRRTSTVLFGLSNP
jgi:MFS transporter, DHA1 family, inner membrane transport protein